LGYSVRVRFSGFVPNRERKREEKQGRKGSNSQASHSLVTWLHWPTAAGHSREREREIERERGGK